MPTLTIRNLEQSLKERLRGRAAARGHSMEAEARLILKDALTFDDPRTGRDFTQRIRARFKALGGIDLEIPPREPPREPPAFD